MTGCLGYVPGSQCVREQAHKQHAAQPPRASSFRQRLYPNEASCTVTTTCNSTDPLPPSNKAEAPGGPAKAAGVRATDKDAQESVGVGVGVGVASDGGLEWAAGVPHEKAVSTEPMVSTSARASTRTRYSPQPLVSMHMQLTHAPTPSHPTFANLPPAVHATWRRKRSVASPRTHTCTQRAGSRHCSSWSLCGH